MYEERAKQWAKDKANQNKVVDALFLQNKPRQAKTAFFMAGIPGAGKTEFAAGVIKASPGLVSIEHDQLVEHIDGYTPQTYYNYRKAGSVLVTRIFDECLRNGYPFVFDGTLSHENGAKNIAKALKCGYEVIVVYIVQDAAFAWQLTQARELVKKRTIERAGFELACKKINKRLLNIFELYKNNAGFSFWVIDKQGYADLHKAKMTIHSPTLRVSDSIEKALQKTYNLEIRK